MKVPIRYTNGADPVPVYRISEDQVNDAYAAFAAMRRATQLDPALLENDYFKALQDTGYARFLAAFEAL